MAKRTGKRTVEFQNGIYIGGFSAVVGPKESEGPLAKFFDIRSEDEFLGEDSFEKAESRLQQLAVKTALKKSGLSESDIDLIFAGDLLNQCIGSAYGLRDFNIPFVGLYGACSTMALSIIMAALSIESGAAQRAVAVTSSHFCSSERQFRFPLEYGGQRTPTAQWTVTGAGSVVVERDSGNAEVESKNKIRIKACTIGKTVDLGITDMNNMGAAMAPDDVKIRPYSTHEGMVFFYTQIQYLRGLRAFFKDFLMQKIVEKTVNEIRC